jgi:hypothetical protein
MRRLEDNIKIGLTENKYDGMDRTELAQRKVQWRILVNTAMSIRVL